LGQGHKAGDNILLCLGSVYRDETAFDEASRSIPGRKNAQRYLDPDAGIHQCIGQILERFQAENLAMTWSRRVITSLHGDAKWSKRSLTMRKLDALPMQINEITG